MTEHQKRFLQLHLIEDKLYESIMQEMNVTRKELSLWYKELRPERTVIASIKTLWLRKQTAGTFPDFYSWYIVQARNCAYCGITETEIDSLLKAKLLATKRISTRGRKLELDRRRPEATYGDLNNLVLACYWCNNAKTDTFTAEEFEEVGKVFAKIWQVHLAALAA